MPRLGRGPDTSAGSGLPDATPAPRPNPVITAGAFTGSPGISAATAASTAASTTAVTAATRATAATTRATASAPRTTATRATPAASTSAGREGRAAQDESCGKSRSDHGFHHGLMSELL